MRSKMSEDLGITVKRDDDISEWYQQVVLRAEFADYSPVKGLIVMRWWGNSIWEAIRGFWDPIMRNHGLKNHYFPLLIPESLLKREAEHFEGFTPEVAWVTHAGENKLEEKLAIRPTSETIMYEMFSKWIKSYRDLPFLVNQWANIMRWETKMTKPFLRSREFLWHEAHTVHKDKEGADEETKWGIDGYEKISEELLAIPVIKGKKTNSDKFAGADYTYAIEALMPDGKALQMGTSHMLGQNFSKPYDVKFMGKDEKWHYAWQTSYGTSTRLIGGLILAHGDDKGAIIPPKVAPVQIVIIPIVFKETDKNIIKKAEELKEKLVNHGFRVEVDSRDEYTAGWKFNHWEVKGVPLRLEIGPRDIKEGKVVVVRRDNGEKSSVKNIYIEQAIRDELDDIQIALFNKLKENMDKNTVETKNVDELKKALTQKKWAIIPHCSQETCEEELSKKVEGGPRVIPFDQNGVSGRCINCASNAKYSLYWGRSY
ncbi:MAG: proline--tRNA ligase [Candidatus Altiarchaeota archaeon]|nr:proline--tRNA ligase [Candidatus Altiarchaeota archaeon]